MSASAHIYRVSQPGDAFGSRQGEILSDVVRIRLDLTTLDAGAPGVTLVSHDFVAVLTQDCDLEQDFKVRTADQISDKLIPNILFCNVVSARSLRGTGIGSEMWKKISQNKDERYHFLQAVDGSCDARQTGLPELGIDFKRYFTLPTDEVYPRIRKG